MIRRPVAVRKTPTGPKSLRLLDTGRRPMTRVAGDGSRAYAIVHYLNQFAAGIGGEKSADLPPRWIDGPVGPGRLLQQALGSGGRVVGTIVCGDDYVATRGAGAAGSILPFIKEAGADALVAGSAFGAGRYGIACSIDMLRRGLVALRTPVQRPTCFPGE